MKRIFLKYSTVYSYPNTHIHDAYATYMYDTNNI